jgi:hypothetical protein
VLKNLLLLLVSSVLTLGAVEALIRKAVIPLPAFRDSNGWWNERWQRRHRGLVPNRFVKLDPALGWIPAPDLDGLPYQGANLSTNSLSIRGKREYTPGKVNRTRIVAIGDSYTFGQCLDDDQTIPAHVEQLLPDSEVINLGVMGYGHDQMLIRLQRDGLRYRPDVVLLGFVEMDLPRNRLHFREYGKPRFYLQDGELALRHVPVKEPDDYEDAFPRLGNYWTMLLDAWRTSRLEAEERELALALVTETGAAAVRAGARFALVYLPIEKDLRAEEPIPVRWLAEACAQNEWLCISPIPRLQEKLRARRIHKHFKCHYSPRVAELVAEEIAVVLAAEFPELFPAGGA